MHAGPQVYQTSEDEGIFECPMGWGPNSSTLNPKT